MEELENIKMDLSEWKLEKDCVPGEQSRERISREIQEHAFKLGRIWEYNGAKVKHAAEPYLFVNDKYLTFGDNDIKRTFEQDSRIQLTPAEFLALPVEAEEKEHEYNSKAAMLDRDEQGIKKTRREPRKLVEAKSVQRTPEENLLLEWEPDLFGRLGRW